MRVVLIHVKYMTTYGGKANKRPFYGLNKYYDR